MLTSVSAALFIFAALIHLYACYFRLTALRRATKPMLMPLLLLCYIARSAAPSPLITAALLLGTLGDVMLLNMSMQHFTLGAMAFAAGHAAYILYMARRIAALACASEQALTCLLSAFLLYAVWTAIVFGALRRELPPHMRPLLPLYMLLIGGMSACAITLAALPAMNGAPAPLPAIVAAVGSALFVVSDSILVFETFGERLKRSRHSNFFVMITYIAAQALLIWGLMGV